MINVFDIGGRMGMHRSWENFGLPFFYYCFEPDIIEASRLQDESDRQNKGINIIPCAISERSENKSLYLYNHRDLSSLFKLNQSATYRYKNAVLEEVLNVQVISLDEAVLNFDSTPHFMSIATQGATLAILMGGRQTLSGCLGLRCEIDFFQLYEKAPLADEVMNFLRSINYKLLRLETCGVGSFGISSEMNEFSVSPSDAKPASADAIYCNENKINSLVTGDISLVEASQLGYFILFCLHNGCGYFGIELAQRLSDCEKLSKVLTLLPEEIGNEIRTQCRFYLMLPRTNINDGFDGLLHYKFLFGDEEQTIKPSESLRAKLIQIYNY